MADDNTFADFLRRIRAGDEQAAAELVRRYESAVRIEVRMRLADSRLRRILDTMDICQSALASFFLRAAAGEYDLERPEQLVRLLVTIARNKVAYQARRQQAQRRDRRRDVEADRPGRELAGAEPSPSRVASGRELLAELRRRLTPEELRVADLRAEGRQWAEIAATLGGTVEARRKQLARALDRVTSQLDLDRQPPRILGMIPLVLAQVRHLPPFLAEQELAVDHLDGGLRVVAQGGEVAEIVGGPDALADRPALALVDPQRGRQPRGR